VNNNKPGEFVSSSGNFFDLASYFFGRSCEPGGMSSPARSYDRFCTIDADPGDRGSKDLLIGVG
jgi:hypothetical protein